MKTEKKINFGEKIFLAGASGMAGSAIEKILLSNNYGNKNLGGQILKPSRGELDLLDINSIKKWFKNKNPSVVIIAAAKVGGIIANSHNPADFLLQNLKIQTNLIETAFNFKIKRLLFLGSSCIYPKYCKQPIKEEYLLQGELEKTNEYYAIAKIAGIKLCESLRKQYGFDAISLMPTNLYGPKDNYHPTNSHVMASLIRKFINAKNNSLPFVTCWGSGLPKREFMHVDDLARAVLFTLENWSPDDDNSPRDEFGNKLYFLNVGTGEDISIAKLAEKIALETNYKGKILWDTTKPDGTPQKKLNVDRLSSLGWKSIIKLEDGLKKTINELQKDKVFL